LYYYVVAGWKIPTTAFEKSKLAERQGRKAAGLLFPKQ
jgi:hypothetical protein